MNTFRRTIYKCSERSLKKLKRDGYMQQYIATDQRRGKFVKNKKKQNYQTQHDDIKWCSRTRWAFEPRQIVYRGKLDSFIRIKILIDAALRMGFRTRCSTYLLVVKRTGWMKLLLMACRWCLGLCELWLRFYVLITVRTLHLNPFIHKAFHTLQQYSICLTLTAWI